MGIDKSGVKAKPAQSNLVADLIEIQDSIKEIANDVNQLFSVVVKQLSMKPREPRSVDEMALCYEKACDMLIAEGKRNGLAYVSGKLNVVAIDADYFLCDTQLYFQDSAGKWIVKKATSGNMSQAAYLTLAAQDEIRKAGKISFEVDDCEN